jgi:hypothetical protein
LSAKEKNRKEKTEEKCRKEFYDFRILGPFSEGQKIKKTLKTKMA